MWPGRSAAVSGLRRVIVGVSGSPASVAALRVGADHARRDDVPLLAVHAWVPPGGDIAERRWPAPELRVVWKKAALELLERTIESAWAGHPGDVRVEHVIMRGHAQHVLTDVASRSDDLLVIGAGSRGPERLWRGQVARYCLAHVRCEVLAVPPPSLARALRPFRQRVLTADQVLRDLEKLGPLTG
jgi:nucleotide-binding universal stress UspA family protein